MMMIFAASGFILATWGSRLPALRSYSHLTAAEVGMAVSSLAAGTLLALLVAGQWVLHLQPIASIRHGAAISALAFVLAASFPTAPVLMVSALLLGFGNGLYDVAMNVRGGRLGSELERRLLPSLHGCWSLGALGGALCTVALTLMGVPLPGHLLFAALLSTWLTWFGTSLLQADNSYPQRLQITSLLPHFDSWRSQRTVSLGLLALGAACAEGAANEWLTLSLTDSRGFGVPQSVAAGGLGIFVVGMVFTRLIGERLLGRDRTATALATSAVLVVLGTALVVTAGTNGDPGSAVALTSGVLGLLLWGVGAALGVPLAMEGAAVGWGANDGWAPSRVSVVLTIGFAAFLPGPLLISSIGERFGYLWSVLLAPGVMVPAFTFAGLLALLDRRRAAAETLGPALTPIPQPAVPVDG